MSVALPVAALLAVCTLAVSALLGPLAFVLALGLAGGVLNAALLSR